MREDDKRDPPVAYPPIRAQSDPNGIRTRSETDGTTDGTGRSRKGG